VNIYVSMHLKIFDINPNNVAKIETQNGSNGKYAIITDKQEITSIINEINSYTFSQKYEFPNSVGFSHGVSIYDALGKKIVSFDANMSGISVGNTRYVFPIPNPFIILYYDNLIH
jgi:hypothetical protein